LDIDDLIFDSLATTSGRHLVNHLEPLPMPSLPRVRGADIKSILMSCILRLGLPRDARWDAQWDAQWDATEGVNTMKAFNNP
jgi:hypothetical protein